MASLPEYTHNQENGPFSCTDDMLQDFNERGFFIVRGLFSKQEINKIDSFVTNNEELAKNSYCLDAGDSTAVRACLWKYPGNDLTGMVSRCERLVGTTEKLLGGEVYHYHTKLIMKQAFTGGNHLWHQDYGLSQLFGQTIPVKMPFVYWYKNGCLFPQMLTAYIAIDRCDKSNGCLQILDGSHNVGRVDHSLSGKQLQADTERVNQLCKVLDLIYVELNPGDCIFFHCNVIHKAGANNSPNRRWALLCAYNKASNNPVYEHHHSQYVRLHKVPDTTIIECTNYTDMTGKIFLNLDKDKSTKPQENDNQEEK